MVLKFLLIDDDLDDRELFCEAIQAIVPETSCYTAAGASKALEKLKNEEIPRPDIIFLDINMPGINGWQCLSILKNQETYKDIPVILYSTTSHVEDVLRGQSLGALCFFTKPTSFKELKKSMEAVVSHLNNDSLAALAESCNLFTRVSS